MWNSKTLVFLLSIYIVLGCLVGSAFGCTNQQENCKKAANRLCDLAPAGPARDGCKRNIVAQNICPKFFCKCKPGWFVDQSSGNCYKVLKQLSNWNTAKQSCATLAPNSALAAVRSHAENRFLKEQLAAAYRYDPTGSVGYLNGANDISVQGKYEWTDHTPVTVFDWASGEPNNRIGERCVEWRRERGWKWNNINCSWPGRFWQGVCKIPA